MKICHVCYGRASIPPEDADSPSLETYRLAKTQASMGYQVDVVSIPSLSRAQRGEAYVIQHIRTPRLPNRSIGYVLNDISFGMLSMLALPKLKKKHCYDIIHFHATTPAFFYSLMFNQDYMPSVFTYGNPALGFMTPLQKKRARALLSLREIDAPKPVKLANLLMEQRLLKRVSMTVTVSLLLKQRIVEFYDLDPRRVRAVHPGVQTEFFKPGIDCSQLRERHGLLDDNLVVLCVAKLAPYKGQLRLIKLIPRIIHAYPRSKFVFVGPMNNTRYASELRALVDSKGLQRNVIFTGAVKTEDLPKYYNLANLFVLLSVAEGLPSTLLEAMSCGCPIIASAIPQNREVAVSGGEAIFVNPFDESAIVEAICKLLGDAALRATLGKAARETAVSWFDWKIIATRILKTYEEILAAF